MVRRGARGWLALLVAAASSLSGGLGLKLVDFEIEVAVPVPEQHYLAPPAGISGKLVYRGEGVRQGEQEAGVLEMMLDEAEGEPLQVWRGELDGKDVEFSKGIRGLGVGPHEVTLRLLGKGGEVEQVRIVPFWVCEPSLSITHPAEGASIPHAHAHSLRVDHVLDLGGCLQGSAAVAPVTVTLDGNIVGRLHGSSLDLSELLRGSGGEHNVTLSLSEAMGRRLLSASRVFSVSTAPRAAVLLYHSRPLERYKQRWISQCLDSILAQSMKDYDLLELDYAATSFSVVKWFLDASGSDHLPAGITHTFLSEPKQNHARAANRLGRLAFSRGYDYVLNVHLDDYYHPLRFERQVEALARGYDVVSGEFRYVRETDSGNDEQYGEDFNLSRLLHIPEGGREDSWGGAGLGLILRLQEGYNPISNSALALSRGMWLAGGGWACGGDELFDDPPDEDLKLWQRCLLQHHLSAIIVPNLLVYTRRHDWQVSRVMQNESDEWHRVSGIR